MRRQTFSKLAKHRFDLVYHTKLSLHIVQATNLFGEGALEGVGVGVQLIQAQISGALAMALYRVKRLQ